MANRMLGVTKAAITGAVLGTAVGMVTVPRARKSKKSKKQQSKPHGKASTALRTVGITMQSVADIIER